MQVLLASRLHILPMKYIHYISLLLSMEQSKGKVTHFVDLGKDCGYTPGL